MTERKLSREERFAPLDEKPKLGPLQQAARAGDVDEVTRLLDAGHDVNEAGPDGDTALHWAAAWGREPVIQLLLARGADPSLRDYENNTPLHLVSKKGFTSAHTFAAILHASKDLVNSPNARGWTPLHSAALRGRADFVQFLLQAGADTAIEDRQGRTPVDLARMKGRQDVIHALEGARSD